MKVASIVTHRWTEDGEGGPRTLIRKSESGKGKILEKKNPTFDCAFMANQVCSGHFLKNDPFHLRETHFLASTGIITRWKIPNSVPNFSKVTVSRAR